uniref:Uncharacterized protein n=1 Tax=Rhizophora mucronata TaxID=61149 RepID=A0A2P2L6Z9_RHIMU
MNELGIEKQNERMGNWVY